MVSTLVISLLGFLLLGASFCSAQTPSLSIFDLGETTTVATLSVPQADDTTSGPIMMGMDVPIGTSGVEYRTAYVSTNGLISFGHPYSYCCPSEFPVLAAPPFVAPLWCDGDTRLAGEVRYEVHSEGEHGTSSELLDSVNEYVTTVLSRATSYRTRWALLTEWKNIHPFPHGFGITDETTEPTNTFQALVITDCFTSYAIFIYECNFLSWSGTVFPARVGISDGNSSLTYFSGSDAATELNNTACNDPNGSYSILVPMGIRDGDGCNVVKGTYIDWLMEHELEERMGI